MQESVLLSKSWHCNCRSKLWTYNCFYQSGLYCDALCFEHMNTVSPIWSQHDCDDSARTQDFCQNHWDLINCSMLWVPLVFRFDEGSCSSACPERVWPSVTIWTVEDRYQAPNCSWQTLSVCGSNELFWVHSDQALSESSIHARFQEYVALNENLVAH